MDNIVLQSVKGTDPLLMTWYVDNEIMYTLRLTNSLSHMWDYHLRRSYWVYHAIKINLW